MRRARDRAICSSEVRTVRRIAIALAFAASALLASGFKPYGTNDLVNLTVPATYRNARGAELNYRLFVPDIPETATNGVPLVLFLHGSGECGTNNVSQLVHGVGGLVWWSKNKEPAIVVAPQSPPMTAWSPVFFNLENATMPRSAPPMVKLVKGLLDELCERYPVDTNRVLATGISLGGYGTWDLVSRYPGYFAGAIPVCGAGDPDEAESAANTAIWIFHGERDRNVPNRMDRAMVSRLWELDAEVRYMEYPDAGHGIWGTVYSSDQVMKWFFSRRRKDMPK